MPLACIDGHVVPAEQATIPATDEGLLRGDGVFEVLRLYDGRPFALDDHLERMAALGRQPAPGRSTSTPCAPTSTRCSRRPARPDGLLRLVRHARRPAPGAGRAAARSCRPRAPGLRHLRARRGCSTGSSRCPTPPTCSPRAWRRSAASTRRCSSPRTGACWRARRRRSSGSATGRLRTPPLDDHILASITRRTRDRGRAGAEEPCTPRGRRAAQTRRSWPPPCARSMPVSAVEDSHRARGGPLTTRPPPRCASASSASWRPRPSPPRRRSPVRVLTVIGNRPQFVKAAAVSRRLRVAPRGGAGPHRPALRRRAVTRLRRRELGDAAARARAGHPRRHEHVADGAHARRRWSRWSPRCSPTRCSSTATRTPRWPAALAGGAGRHPGGARRGGHALLRPHDARGAQPRAHRPPLATCCCARRPTAVENLRREGVAGRVEEVGDVMVDVARCSPPRARERTRGRSSASACAPASTSWPPRTAPATSTIPPACATLVGLLAGAAAAGGAAAAPAHPRAPGGRRACWTRLDERRRRAPGPAAGLPGLHRAAVPRPRACSPTPAGCRRRPTWPACRA